MTTKADVLEEQLCPRTGSRRAAGSPLWPLREMIVVAELGQPDRSPGGIYYGDYEWASYKASEWRYGQVIGIGPGKIDRRGRRQPMPELRIGDIVLYSRRHGSRLPASIRFRHSDFPEGLLIRILDPQKTMGVVEDFRPWWDVQRRQLDPALHFSG